MALGVFVIVALCAVLGIGMIVVGALVFALARGSDRARRTGKVTLIAGSALTGVLVVAGIALTVVALDRSADEIWVNGPNDADDDFRAELHHERIAVGGTTYVFGFGGTMDELAEELEATYPQGAVDADGVWRATVDGVDYVVAPYDLEGQECWLLESEADYLEDLASADAA